MDSPKGIPAPYVDFLKYEEGLDQCGDQPGAMVNKVSAEVFSNLKELQVQVEHSPRNWKQINKKILTVLGVVLNSQSALNPDDRRSCSEITNLCLEAVQGAYVSDDHKTCHDQLKAVYNLLKQNVPNDLSSSPFWQPSIITSSYEKLSSKIEKQPAELVSLRTYTREWIKEFLQPNTLLIRPRLSGYPEELLQFAVHARNASIETAPPLLLQWDPRTNLYAWPDKSGKTSASHHSLNEALKAKKLEHLTPATPPSEPEIEHYNLSNYVLQNE